MRLKSIQLLLPLLGWLVEPQVRQVNIWILFRRRLESCQLLDIISDQTDKQRGNRPTMLSGGV